MIERKLRGPDGLLHTLIASGSVVRQVKTTAEGKSTWQFVARSEQAAQGFVEDRAQDLLSQGYVKEPRLGC